MACGSRGGSSLVCDFVFGLVQCCLYNEVEFIMLICSVSEGSQKERVVVFSQECHCEDHPPRLARAASGQSVGRLESLRKSLSLETLESWGRANGRQGNQVHRCPRRRGKPRQRRRAIHLLRKWTMRERILPSHALSRNCSKPKPHQKDNLPPFLTSTNTHRTHALSVIQSTCTH